MNKIDPSSLGIVQETALLTLWSRAEESTHESPVLVDERAQELVASIDYDFDKFRKFQRGQLGCCCRAAILDGYVRDYLQKQPSGIVVEIGAGLDTRFDRLDNGQVCWFDLDLPDSIEMRRNFFEPSDRRQFIAGSILEPATLEAIPRDSETTPLFVAEGVLLYFAPRDVKDLLCRLATDFPRALFAFDTCSPLMQKTARLFEAVGTTKAGFQWGIQDIRQIERWDKRFRVLDQKHVTQQHLDRWPGWVRWMNRILPSTRRFYSAGLLQLGNQQP